MRHKDLSAKAADIFLKAAEYIRIYGWQEKGMSTHGKERCSMGALQSAGEEKTWDKKLSRLMYESLQENLEGISLTEFNLRCKKGESVAKLFERTAQSLVSYRKY